MKIGMDVGSTTLTLLLLVQVDDVELIPDVQFPHLGGLTGQAIAGELLNACFHTITSTVILL